MAKSKNYHTYEELVELLKKSGRAYNFDIIAKAYKFAKEAHKFQKKPPPSSCILYSKRQRSISGRVMAALFKLYFKNF